MHVFTNVLRMVKYIEKQFLTDSEFQSSHFWSAGYQTQSCHLDNIFHDVHDFITTILFYALEC